MSRIRRTSVIDPGRRAALVTAAAFVLAPSLSGIVRAQQPGRVRTVAVLMPYPVTDAEMQGRVAAFRDELARLGWRPNATIRFDERWTTDDPGKLGAAVSEIVASRPDVIMVSSSRALSALARQTANIPIVFAGAAIYDSLVQSVARPGGNVTGFAASDTPLFEKQLDILRQLAPGVRRVLFVFNPDNPNTQRATQLFEETARRFSVAPVPVAVQRPADLEQALAKEGPLSGTAALFPSDATTLAQREQVVGTIARHRIPAIYSARAVAASGGLASYSPDFLDLFRRTADYVSRILHGETAAQLPVQLPTTFVFVLNMKAAKALDITIPAALLVAADEVIE
jgi:putative tryptophan/tyrosine transport system substrate-binding protein